MTDYTDFVTAPETSATTEVIDFHNHKNHNEPGDIHLWFRMLNCCTMIENELRSKIRSEFKTTLPRFDLMSKLANVDAGLKMSELSRLMMVTNGNITGITDQLEKDGLVERIKDESDRRSSIIRLTTKGRHHYQQLQRAYDNWVTSLMGGLAPKSRTALFKLLGDLQKTTNAQLPA